MEISNSLKLLTHWPEMDIYHLWTHIWDNMRENLGEIIAGWGRLGLENQGTCEERSDFIWLNRIWKRLSVLLYLQIWGLGRKPKGLWGLLWSKTLGLDPEGQSHADPSITTVLWCYFCTRPGMSQLVPAVLLDLNLLSHGHQHWQHGTMEKWS